MFTRKMLLMLTIMLVTMATSVSLNGGEFSLGADVYNRYVWRGMDFGNAPVIQPYLAYSTGNLELGAWSSWPLTDQGFNENDLYVSYTYNNFNITVFDYFYPGYTGNDNIDDFSDNGAHIIETSARYTYSDLSLMAAVNVLGFDTNNSKYIELNYLFYDRKGISASVFAGGGDFMYSLDDGFAVTNIGINLAKDRYSASYAINPDRKTSFFAFGISF